MTGQFVVPDTEHYRKLERKSRDGREGLKSDGALERSYFRSDKLSLRGL